MRNLIGRIIAEYDGLEVVAKAENGQDLLDKIPVYKPDVILLDIEMPVMTGVQFLEQRKLRHIDIPVIILSSIATEGAAVTMRCLELGAADFITKPGGSVSLKIGDVSDEIIDYVSSYGASYAIRKGKHVPDPDYFHHQVKLKAAARFVAQKKGEDASKLATVTKPEITPPATWSAPKNKEPAVITPEREGGRIEIIAIGISTGGPNALRDMLAKIDPNLKQPILVVQHMPAGFTTEFAESLNHICPLEVSEAKNGEPVLGGHVYIAPGNYHLMVEKRSLNPIIKLTQDDLRNGHRPSADWLFESVAQQYGNKALGVIMTGMGRDGAAQLAEMRKKGAWTLGQDQASCIVYGMPKVAWEMGAVQRQVPLQLLADEISKLANAHLNS